MNITLKTPKEIRQEIAARAKRLRLDLNISQMDLAARTGVSLSSIKRFESQGLISLSSLLHIALVLDRLQDFETLFVTSTRLSLFLPTPKKRLRAGIKNVKS